MTCKRFENRRSALVLLAALALTGGCRADLAAPLDGPTIAPDNKAVLYSGRFDRSDPTTAVYSWPATAVTLRFRGTGIDAHLGLGDNRIVATIDGAVVATLAPKGEKGDKPAPQRLTIARDLAPGDHTVTLTKATEPNVGNATFGGFVLTKGGVALPPVAPKRRIEVIGDSISAGYGIEAASKDEHFSPATENAYLTYGALTARAVKADYTCIAWSGRTMWPDFTIPEIYDRVLPKTAEPKWPATAPKPDVYLINLATNDFARKVAPEEETWVKAYKTFVAKLRAGAPEAVIYCATSPMMNDAWPAGRQARSTAGAYIRRVVREFNAAGDRRVKFLEFEQQNGEADGLGADWHPSVKTNEKMAAVFTAAVKAEMGW